ncbi:MAG: phosphotransferase [Paramuribaculum sp.]|nr:phosphotransferase [Paramuribaculum sp.]
MEKLKQLYTAAFGSEPAEICPLPAAGSHRRYFRLSGSGGCVAGTLGCDVAENRAFISLAGALSAIGVNVPEVLAVSDDSMAYLQTWADGSSLYDYLGRCRESGVYDDEAMSVLRSVMRDLAAIHSAPRGAIDYSTTVPVAEFAEDVVMWDLNHFKYCFLKVTGTGFDEAALERDLRSLAALTSVAADDGFMYRDFQSRNIMVSPSLRRVYIDFQGGYRGPAAYDVVAFLWQSRARYPEAVREDLLQAYCEARGFDAAGAEAFRAGLPLFRLLRTLQTLGTYGLRGLVERKQMFVDSIPSAIDQLRSLPHDVMSRFPELSRIISSLPAVAGKHGAGGGQLTVTVGSFSYKRGLPADPSGNGGGFVFDCRAVHNPGRYDRFKPLTGRDREVAEFLAGEPEASAFIGHAEGLADASVSRYVERGFTSLSVWFGCTGGQHRSVYFAELMARHLKESFPMIAVRLIHREQAVDCLL